MADNQRRRSTERQLLQKQLAERRTREARRRRVVLVSSVVGTVVIIAAVVTGVLVATSGSGDTKSTRQAGGQPSSQSSPQTSPQSGAETAAPTGNCKVGFLGVTVKNKTDLKKEPGVRSTGCEIPTKLEYQDLVTGKGKTASPSSTVEVQYTGVLYKNGLQFDSSWERKQPATFSLQQVVKGFTQGIGGGSGVPPMKVGGRRIMILPASLGYGPQAQGSIPANSPLVFVVDLLATK